MSLTDCSCRYGRPYGLTRIQRDHMPHISQHHLEEVYNDNDQKMSIILTSRANFLKGSNSRLLVRRVARALDARQRLSRERAAGADTGKVESVTITLSTSHAA